MQPDPTPNISDDTGIDAASALTTFRGAALKKASDITRDPSVEQPEYRAASFFQLAVLLASALDFLHVAEQSLVRYAAREREAAAKARYDRHLFDAAPVPLLITTRTGAITEANRAATLLFGYDVVQLERKPLVDFLPLEERQGFRARLQRAGAVGDMTHWRFRVVRRRNAPLPVSAVVSAAPGMNKLAASEGLFWCLKTSTEEWLPSTHQPNSAIHGAHQ
jgi:PAS domain S-box-containing protein